MATLTRKVILDMDPGIDDALALILAVKIGQIKVLGVTTTAGNVEVKKATKNALKVLELLGEARRIPVSPGSGKTLTGRPPPTAENIHGTHGLGGAVLPPPRTKPSGRCAVDFIAETVLSEDRGEVEVISTGPLTNVALALLKEPRLATWLRRVVSMGGAFGVSPYGHGNCTPVAEFNVFCDPEAAEVVYSSGVRVLAVGLDVTMMPEACLSRAQFGAIKKLGRKNILAKFMADAMAGWFRKWRRVPLHDPLTVAAAAYRELVNSEPFPVRVELRGELTRGQTIADRRKPGKGNVEVCTDVKGRRFLSLFLEQTLRLGLSEK